MHVDTAHATDRENNPTAAARPITPLDDNNNVNVDDEMEKEELVTHTLRLKQEVSRNNSKIQSLTLQRDCILDKKPQVLEILHLIEALSDAKDADACRTTCTVGTTAVVNTIDKLTTLGRPPVLRYSALRNGGTLTAPGVSPGAAWD